MSGDGENFEAIGSSGHLIVAPDGSEMPQRGRLKLLNGTVSDDAEKNQTVISGIPGPKGDTGTQGIQGIQGPGGEGIHPHGSRKRRSDVGGGRLQRADAAGEKHKRPPGRAGCAGASGRAGKDRTPGHSGADRTSGPERGDRSSRTCRAEGHSGTRKAFRDRREKPEQWDRRDPKGSRAI